MDRDQFGRAQVLLRRINIVEEIDRLISIKGYLLIETPRGRITLYADDAAMIRKSFGDSIYKLLVDLNDEFKAL